MIKWARFQDFLREVSGTIKKLLVHTTNQSSRGKFAKYSLFFYIPSIKPIGEKENLQLTG
jgi:hypothetical protein